MTNETKSKLSRRNFLIAAGVGGAAAAGALVTQSVNPERPVAGNDKRSGKGYQDSAHVRSYYNTAKV